MLSSNRNRGAVAFVAARSGVIRWAERIDVLGTYCQSWVYVISNK